MSLFSIYSGVIFGVFTLSIHISALKHEESLKPCSESHGHLRELIDCNVNAPHYVKIHCQSWNTVGISIKDNKYVNMPPLKPLVIECQRGSPFFLDLKQLNWESQTYKIMYDNQIFIEEKSPGIYNRHNFLIRISLENVSRILDQESYQFYTQNDQGSPQNLTKFTFFVSGSTGTEENPKPRSNYEDSASASPKKLIIEFKENSAAVCKAPESEEIEVFYSVNFTKPSESQDFIQCLNKYSINDCTKRKLCGGNDTLLNCGGRIISCNSATADDKTSCTLETVHASGVLLCATKKETKIDAVEFFTALDGAKYRGDDNELAIDKLVKVKLEKGDKGKLFYTDQWITITYEVVTYRYPGSVYWEYKLKNGHLGTFNYGDERQNIADGKVELKMKKDIRQIAYFVPWSPYPMGSVINVLVTDKKAPMSAKNESKLETTLGTLGEELDLVCEIWGNPLPNIEWIKDDIRVEGDSSKRTILMSSSDEKRVSILHLKSFTHADMGKYICNATNSESFKSIEWTVGVNSSIGYEAAVAIVLILVAIVLIGAICYQIWSPPPADEV